MPDNTLILELIKELKKDLRLDLTDLRKRIGSVDKRVTIITTEIVALRNMHLARGLENNGGFIRSFFVKTLPWLFCGLLIGAASIGYFLAIAS